MMKQKLTILIFLMSLFLPLSAHASSGTVLSAYKYAWSDQVGYINFAPTNGGVNVTDSALSGYAWSENTGYINFAPAHGGVHNDGSGHLSGSAWGEGVGYIDFSGVTINPPVGGTRKFSGTATGALIGTINFDCAKCDVRTDWEPGTTLPPGGGGGGGGKLPITIPGVSINGNNPNNPNIPPIGPGSLSGLPGVIGGPSALQAGAGTPLFDVVSAPVQSTNGSAIPSGAVPAVGGILFAVLGVLVLRFMLFPLSLRVAYYNATDTAGVSGIVEKIIQKEFSNFKTVSVSHNPNGEHKGNIIVDLSGTHGSQAAKMAKLLNGRVESIPASVAKPDADILVISGN